MNVIKLCGLPCVCHANRTVIFIIAVEMRLIFVFVNNDTVGSGIMIQCALVGVGGNL